MSLQPGTTLSYLFGGDRTWNFNAWQASDDRVRGGASQSYLEPANHHNARFHGTLDTTTLGGAGFASQRTSDSAGPWDLSPYSGLSLKFARGDGKKYTLVLKDEVLPLRADGREQSTVSWEFDFVAGQEGGEEHVSWDDLKPTYRGKPRPEAPPLKLERVERLSLMMRSFFAQQQGPFDLEVVHIAAMSSPSTSASGGGSANDPNTTAPSPYLSQGPSDGTWLGWVRGWFRGAL